MIAAATGLFREKGWTATGMRDVAREAGVAVETVYANYRSKGELLTACVDLAVVADPDPTPLNERRAFAALAIGTPTQRARKAARLVADIHDRTAGLLRTVREAAASDPDMAQWRRAGEERRRSDVAQAAALIRGSAVTSDECDGLWAVTSSELHELLTQLRGWSRPQYERWLARAIEQLLDHPSGDK